MNLLAPTTLTSHHKLDAFSSGEPILDDWLKRRARAELAAAAGFDLGGTFRAYVGKLVGLGAVNAAGVGAVSVADWVWAE